MLSTQWVQMFKKKKGNRRTSNFDWSVITRGCDKRPMWQQEKKSRPVESVGIA